MVEREGKGRRWATLGEEGREGRKGSERRERSELSFVKAGGRVRKRRRQRRGRWLVRPSLLRALGSGREDDELIPTSAQSLPPNQQGREWWVRARE